MHLVKLDDKILREIRGGAEGELIAEPIVQDPISLEPGRVFRFHPVSVSVNPPKDGSGSLTFNHLYQNQADKTMILPPPRVISL